MTTGEYWQGLRTMKGKYSAVNVDFSNVGRREEMNNLILKQIRNNLKRDERYVPNKKDVFVLYSGKGKLHGVRFEECPSYHDYKTKKDAEELGQFFTNNREVRKISFALDIEEKRRVFDPTCGHGAFANYMPDMANFWGLDIDIDNIDVANYLFPACNWQRGDITSYINDKPFDYIVSNPPFNFRWNGMNSQQYIIEKSIDWLKPYGFLAIIVPEEYLRDDFYYKSAINTMNDHFHFIGSIALRIPFKQYKVSIGTKVMFFQKRPLSAEKRAFNPMFGSMSDDTDNWIDIVEEIKECKAIREKNILTVVAAQSYSNNYSFARNAYLSLDRVQNDKAIAYVEIEEKDKEKGYEFILKKYLYELKRKDNSLYERALTLIQELNTQVQPPHLGHEEWQQQMLTKNKVLSRLKQMLSDKKRNKRKYPDRKKSFNTLQTVSFNEMEQDAQIKDFLNNFRLITPEDNGASLLEFQKNDLNLFLQKNYSIINWEQGTGKTVGMYTMSKYRNCLTVIVAPAHVLRDNWMSFLEINNESFEEIKSFSQLESFDKDYLLITYGTLARNKKLAKDLKRFLRVKYKNKVSVFLDEADRIGNPSTNTAKNTLVAFQKAKYKTCGTGTVIRNNATEYWNLLYFLYNGSSNLINTADTFYKEKKTKENGVVIIDVVNHKKDKAFKPAFKGYNEFKYTFSPSKKTVFGIEKQTQDVYNYDLLLEIMSYTQITRTFKEVFGDRFGIDYVDVVMTMGEFELQDQILKETQKIIKEFFQLSGNARKDAGRRMLQKINLLLKACSTPELFSDYKGGLNTKCLKTVDMVRQRNTHVVISCTRLDTLDIYEGVLKSKFPERELFVINGNVSIPKRRKILDAFEKSGNGILLCTQQSLASGVNIPFVNEVIIESLPWNFSALSQHYFRFVRYTSKSYTNIYILNYADSIEKNVMALMLAKEKIAKTLKFEDGESVYEEYGVSSSLLNEIMQKVYDPESKTNIVQWGKQKLQK